MLKTYFSLRLFCSVLFASFVAQTLLTSSAFGAEEATVKESIWLLSTRAICRADLKQEAPSPTFHHLNEQGDKWEPSSADEFYAKEESKLPTVFVVHGNRYNANEAIVAAEAVRKQLNADPAKTPYRLVIWSWPSAQKVRRPRRDVQIKASRTKLESFCLAQCLNRLDPDTRLNLVGFSFGSRIIAGSLHLLDGGKLYGLALQGRKSVQRTSVNVMLIAAAMNYNGFSSGCRYGKALEQANQVFITRNGCDRALRWYSAMYRLRGPQALGFVGPSRCGLKNEKRDKLEVLDVSCAVGRSHDWLHYVSVRSLQERLREYTFPPTEKVASQKENKQNS